MPFGWRVVQTIPRPIYCNEVTSESIAAELADSLPLIYLWNEDLRAGTFSLSINGSLLGYLIEALIPRADESFQVVRDSVMAALAASTRHAVVKACETVGLPPSIAFDGE